jgi:hypothetical protein
MPVTVIKTHGKYRVVEENSGQIAKNKGGIALDGGGHNTYEKALAQSRAVNRSLHKRGKI